jgi:hypothetical protein
MLNRRKAMIGYAVYTIGKPVVLRLIKKRKSLGTADAAKKGGWRVSKKGIVAAAIAAIGALAFWRKRRKSHQALES